jgi:hypothetical protein
MQTNIVEVTPLMASKMLQRNSRNRNISYRLVDSYASDMKAGRWHLTHQGIAIYEDGEIADGQHRLSAIVKSGCAIDVMLTTGVTRTASLGIDTNRPRSPADVIRIGGVADWVGQHEVAIVNMIESFSSSSQAKLTPQCIAAKAQIIKEEIQFAITHLPKKKHVSAAPIRACVAIAYQHIETARLAEFCSVLMSGIPSGISDVAAIRLREFLISDAALRAGMSHRLDCAKRTMRAIKAFSDKQPISKLFAPQAFIYELVNADEFKAAG